MKKMIVTEKSLIKCLSILNKMKDGPILTQAIDYLFVDEDALSEYDKRYGPMMETQSLKPFGPGTRLRAANGDELLIVRTIGDNRFLSCINLRLNMIHYDTWSPESLQQTLAMAGATVIEEGK